MAKKIDLNGLDHFKEKENAMIASEYSSSKTYAIGDYVYYAGTLYVCTTAITTAEAWTAGHWTAAKLADDCSALKTAITEQSEEIDTQLGKYLDLIPLSTTGGAITSNGGTSTSATYSNNYKFSDYIEVAKDETISYWLRSPFGNPMIAFYTSKSVSDFKADKSVIGTGGNVSGVYTVPEDGFIRITTRNDLTDKTATLNENGMVQNLIANSDNRTDAVSKSVFTLANSFVINGFLTVSGRITEHADYWTTDFIWMKQGETFIYSIGMVSVQPIINFYTERDLNTFVSGSTVNGANAYTSGAFTAPSDGYVRITCYKNKIDNSYVIFSDAIPKNVKNYVDTNAVKSHVNGLKILCLGDSIFGNDGEIVQYLHDLSGATVINGAFGGTRVSDRGGSDNFQYFDGVNLVSALCSQTWTNQDAAATAMAQSYAWVADRLATLKAVDMSTVDLITMDWGSNDYTGGQTIETITAAYTSVINDLQETYPTIRILIITPMWRYFNAKADNENADNYKFNVSTLKEIASAIATHAQDMRIELLNMYQKMPLSYNTADAYFDTSSNVHLNATGNMVYAHILNGKILSMY